MDAQERQALHIGEIRLFHPPDDEKPQREYVGTVNVVVLFEDDAWCAIVLEMGIRSYGDTVKAAFATLQEAVRAQVTFTMEHGDWNQMFMHADQRYIDLYMEELARRITVAVQLSDIRDGVYGETIVEAKASTPPTYTTEAA